MTLYESQLYVRSFAGIDLINCKGHVRPGMEVQNMADATTAEILCSSSSLPLGAPDHRTCQSRQLLILTGKTRKMFSDCFLL